MIGRLSGTLIAKQPPLLLLDVHGVGYEIEAPMSTFFKLPAIGQAVVLQTHLVIREDAHLLFGFATGQEKALFREIMGEPQPAAPIWFVDEGDAHPLQGRCVITLEDGGDRARVTADGVLAWGRWIGQVNGVNQMNGNYSSNQGVHYVVGVATPQALVPQADEEAVEYPIATLTRALAEAPAQAWSTACTGLDCKGVSVGFGNSIKILLPSLLLSVFMGSHHLGSPSITTCNFIDGVGS